jgi:CRP-like cAMP-binding protein
MRTDSSLTVARLLRTQPGLGLDSRGLTDEIPTSVGMLVHAVRTLEAEDSFRPRFTAENWRTLGSYLVRRTLRPGDILIRQGDVDRSAFLVESGTLLVYTRATPGPASPISLLRAGALVGEAALFGDSTRMAQVEALSPCVVWSLVRPRLDELRFGFPELAYELLRAAGTVMAHRMRKALTTGLPQP